MEKKAWKNLYDMFMDVRQAYAEYGKELRRIRGMPRRLKFSYGSNNSRSRYPISMWSSVR